MNSNFDAKSADYEEEARDASEFGTRTIVICVYIFGDSKFRIPADAYFENIKTGLSW